ncbi:MAG: hypothetical protein WC490_04995 [Candidatus Margulisiibacteriota bacterium]
MAVARKKLLLAGAIIIMMSASLIKDMSAASSTGDLSVSVTVPSVFSLNLDPYSVDFGSVRYGEWKEVPSGAGYANRAVCKSNTGNPWQVMIRADGPLSSSDDSIPLSNLRWMSTYAGNAASPYQDMSSGLRHKPAEGYIELATSDELVYTSGTNPLLNDNSNLPEGTEIQFKYSLQVPSDPAPLGGAYTTVIRYTMTE